MPSPRPLLYAHPFSSYSQKALIALYENDTPFVFRHLEDPEAKAEFAKLWPLQRFPILVDGTRVVLEASCVIEYLDLHYPGPQRLIPQDPDAALEVRMLDRFFDNYVSTPQQAVIYNALRAQTDRDAYGERQARERLQAAYVWLDAHMAGREWAVGNSFSMADCAAAPFLFYADWTDAIPPQLQHVHAYRARLLARASVRRAVDAARAYRHYFPLGAPDRD